MLKKKALNKIYVTTVCIFVIMVIYTLKLKDEDTTIYSDTYHITDNDKTYIYALNEDNLLVKTTVYVDNSLSIIDKTYEVLNIMIENNNKNALLPSNLNPILPRNTKINNITFNDGVLKIDFSKELLNIEEDQSEKMIESIVYSLSSFNDVIGIELSVEGSILKYIPNTKITLPTILTKDFGINKVYNITSNKEINKIFLYFYMKDNDNLYVVPVTSYVNDDREKIEIIIESLSSYINKNLISYVDPSIKLVNFIEDNNTIKLVFDNSIYDNKVLKEDALNMIMESVFSNYEVKNIEILVGNTKVLEKKLE